MASRPTSNRTSILVSFLPENGSKRGRRKSRKWGREDRGRNKGLVSTEVSRHSSSTRQKKDLARVTSTHAPGKSLYVEERKKPRVFPNVSDFSFQVLKFGQRNRNVDAAWKKRACNESEFLHHRVTRLLDSLLRNRMRVSRLLAISVHS